MLSNAEASIIEAEQFAAGGGTLKGVLRILRKLSLDEFGLFMISLPNPKYPALSGIFPAMASEDIQRRWTGGSGANLLGRTASFVRQLSYVYGSRKLRSLDGTTMLDFGCGYGRIIRLMYYFTDPENINGVDAWQESLDLCLSDRVLGNFMLSDPMPERLPVKDGSISLAYSFSVFTHLSEKAANAALSAIRRTMRDDGLFAFTIRPVEFWTYRDQQEQTSAAERLTKQHQEKGFAYMPSPGPKGEYYGETTIQLDYFKNIPGWRFVGYDWSQVDVYQSTVLLEPS